MAQHSVVAGSLGRLINIAAILVCVSGCYVTRQAWHQGRLLSSRRSVTEVVDDPNTSDETRQRLAKVRSILAYAAKERLNTEGAYAYLIQTDQPAVSYLVQAAPATKLELVTWWFPIVGRVPYLGFFDKSERDAEAARLRREGYDIALTGAGAFSSLGWFNDPIFSSMLLRRDAELAHLFFHELTHRTIWVPDAAAFNENLAEYAAVVLTRQYLAANSDVTGLRVYEQRREDKDKFTLWLADLKHSLQQLYAKDYLSQDEKVRLKAGILAEFQNPPKRPRFSQLDLVAGEAWNNASILGATLYSPDFEAFDSVRRCLGNPPIKDFLDRLGQTVRDHDGQPMVMMAKLCPVEGHMERKA